MIDIASLHRKSGSKKILGKFFATSGYRDLAEYLRESGLEDKEIAMRSQAYRGAVGIAKVHPSVVIEYLRWVDFGIYANWVDKKVSVPEAPQG